MFQNSYDKSLIEKLKISCKFKDQLTESLRRELELKTKQLQKAQQEVRNMTLEKNALRTTFEKLQKSRWNALSQQTQIAKLEVRIRRLKQTNSDNERHFQDKLRALETRNARLKKTLQLVRGEISFPKEPEPVLNQSVLFRKCKNLGVLVSQPQLKRLFEAGVSVLRSVHASAKIFEGSLNSIVGSSPDKILGEKFVKTRDLNSFCRKMSFLEESARETTQGFRDALIDVHKSVKKE